MGLDVAKRELGELPAEVLSAAAQACGAEALTGRPPDVDISGGSGLGIALRDVVVHNLAVGVDQADVLLTRVMEIA